MPGPWTRVAVLALVSAPALPAFSAGGQSAVVQLQNPRPWEHALGPQMAVHLSATEAEQFRRTHLGREYLEFDIIVSESGRVETASLIGGVRLHAEEGQAIELARTFKPWMQNGSPIRARFRDVVSLLPPEQWAEKHVPFPEVSDLSSVTISLKRTPCYGSCPAYTVTITGDSLVRFSGQASVRIPGDHVAHIPPESVRELLQQFRKADFLSAKDRYSASVSDSPMQTLTLRIGPLTKTVVDYVGIEAGLPLAIRNLESIIDETTDTARWITGNDQTVPALLAEKWSFKAGTEQNLALYASAIASKDADLLHQFLAAGAPIVAPSTSIASPVCLASATGDLALVRRMTENTKKFPPAVLNQCLSSAARSGNLALLQLWLDHGADPTAKPEKVQNDWLSDAGPLPQAILSGKADVVRKLLLYKVDLHAEVREHESLLSLALHSSDGKPQAAEIVTLLIQAGADVNARDSRGQTPIFAMQDAPASVKPLLAAGASIEARDDSGRTPLISNAYSEPILRELLAHGADPTATAKNGDTALKVAHQFNCAPCATLIEKALKQRGAPSASQ